MKPAAPPPRPDESGSALVLTLIMTGIALAILASAMAWSAHSTRMTHRSIQYTRSVAAAEAGTEKILSRMAQDYLSGGAALVGENLDSYRALVPTLHDSSYWKGWEFNNAEGNLARSYVQHSSDGAYSSKDSSFAKLKGFTTTYTVVAHARESNAPQTVVAGVLQEIKLSRLPIFQFAMYSSGILELAPGGPMTVVGPIHANDTLYFGPSSTLICSNDVSSVGSILLAYFWRTNTPGGTVVYGQGKHEHVGALNLPIGTNNTPTAIREIILPPPVGESATSTLGRMRYYNQADMILTVSDSGVTATSGYFNGFATLVPSNQLAAVVTTTNQFSDGREVKIIKPIDINIGALKAWSATNTSLRTALGSKDVASVYVHDKRTLPGTQLGAVRVFNGAQLPARGLTIVTARPLYTWGHYNQFDSGNLGTTNTSTTLPASLVGDAFTVLSPNWTDKNSTNLASARIAAPVTVNAAILAGMVDSEVPGGYSGGFENFLRLLENWTDATGRLAATYNGSMVKMFPSFYATNKWKGSGVYSIPTRNWAYDKNFDTLEKLPPLTPGLSHVARGQWATVAADKNVATASP